jgi:hypothetical protein
MEDEKVVEVLDEGSKSMMMLVLLDAGIFGGGKLGGGEVGEIRGILGVDFRDSGRVC